MKSTVAKENPERAPFLEKQVLPEKLELVWDNWRSQPEVRHSFAVCCY